MVPVWLRCGAALMVAACAAPAAAQAAPGTTLWMITDRGGLFEVGPPDGAPTTDVVSAPYVEFRRVGGLVANGHDVRPATQYNAVSDSHTTYIIDDWGAGTTHGVPNAAPLGGELRLWPVPHLYLRETVRISGTVPAAEAVRGVEAMSGTAAHSHRNHTEYGEYLEATGHGRSIVWLEAHPTNRRYAVNLVCTDCQDDTPAVIGSVPDAGGRPASGPAGSPAPVYAGVSGNCTAGGEHADGCGAYPGGEPWAGRLWPADPTPAFGAAHRAPHGGAGGHVLNVTRMDTASCPGASRHDVEARDAGGGLFHAFAGACRMRDFEYRWHDGNVALEHSMPLRPGMNEWTSPGGGHPAVVLNARGGQTLLQAYLLPGSTPADAVLNPAFSVDAGGVVGPGAVAVLHDARLHLGAYTMHDLHRMADRIQTHPQAAPHAGLRNASLGGGSPGAPLPGWPFGGDCAPGYRYCLRVFDSGALPAVRHAQGKVWDSRNHVALNGDPSVLAGQRVFGAAGFGGVPVRAGALEMVQSYAVIPVTGALSVERLYVTAHPDGCQRYEDRSVRPHGWASAGAWLRLGYLETDYGGPNRTINVPLLPGYGTLCMRAHGDDGFRQIALGSLFVQGDAASFGGVERARATPVPAGALGAASGIVHVLDARVPLPGGGPGTADIDVELSGAVTISGVVPGGGSHPDCGGAAPPRRPAAAVLSVTVDVRVPDSGSHKRVDGLDVHGSGEWRAVAPPGPAGADCRHVSGVSFEWDPVYRTVPVEYAGSDAAVTVRVSAAGAVSGGGASWYGAIPVETMHTWVHIERLAVRVN